MPEGEEIEPTLPFTKVLFFKSNSTKLLLAFGLTLMTIDVFVIPIAASRVVQMLGTFSLVAWIYYLLSWHTLKLHSSIIFEVC
jgi:hypothetical protein